MPAISLAVSEVYYLSFAFEELVLVMLPPNYTTVLVILLFSNFTTQFSFNAGEIK